MRGSKSLHLILAMAVAVAAMGVPLSGVRNTPLAAALGIPLVLVLPGYALAQATFPRHALHAPELLTFAIGFSLAIAVLGGLVLNWTPFGLQPGSWSGFLGGVTLVLSGAALMRQRVDIALTSRGLRVPVLPVLVLGIAAIVVAGAIIVASSAAVQEQQAQGFTELWMLPAGASAESYAVHLGVGNMQPTAAEYRLEVVLNGKPVRVWPRIALMPHKTWEVIIAVPVNGHAAPADVEATLYRPAAPTVAYRHVQLWLGN